MSSGRTAEDRRGASQRDRDQTGGVGGLRLTEPVGVQGQTLQLQEVPDERRKNLDLVPRQIHGPQVGRESLELLWKLKQDRS